MLSTDDKKQILELIKALELNTSGEIVLVLAKRSGNYHFTSLFLATIFALSTPLLMYFFPSTTFIIEHFPYIIFSQLAALILFFGILNLTGWNVKFTPKSIKYTKASRLAKMQFFKQGLHFTKDRAAIMLFASFAEKYVEIIADKGIDDLVPDETWSKIVSDFLYRIKKNEIKDAFIFATEECGKILNNHFPIKDKQNPNELTDVLIEI